MRYNQLKKRFVIVSAFDKQTHHEFEHFLCNQDAVGIFLHTLRYFRKYNKTCLFQSLCEIISCCHKQK